MRIWSRSHFVAILIVPAAVAIALAAPGCGETGGSETPRSPAVTANASDHAIPAAPIDHAIAVDAAFDDWPEGVRATSDAGYVYFQLRLPEPRTLQASAQPVALHIDFDGSAATGLGLSAGEKQIGADLTVVFSPPSGDPDEPNAGTHVVLHLPERSVRMDHETVGMMFAPTVQSDRFEIRLVRADLERLLGRPVTALRAIATVDANAAATGDADAQIIDQIDGAVTAATVRPARRDLAIPAKPAGAIRVVSYNVLKGMPHRQPEPFARILRLLEPDIILFQEWEIMETDTLVAWLDRHVPVDTGWSGTAGEHSVAIASRYPATPLLTDWLGIAGDRNLVPFVAIRTQTPIGPVAAGSIHLRCCGGAGSPEDQTRIAQAEAIDEFLKSLPIEKRRQLIIGGDINLVGSITPLQMLAVDADADGSDLSTADADVLGDAATYTWRDPHTPFSPGRLDWLLYSDASLKTVNAFVLDTARLTSDRLRAYGLKATDTDHSDHLPVVVDLMPRD